MGAEMVVIAVGPGTTLGWLLDTQRAVARADRTLARPQIFQSRVESTRSVLLRFDRSVLDWSPVVKHVPRLLHGRSHFSANDCRN